MADSSRKMLRNGIKSQLLPALAERGFEMIPTTGADAASRELRVYFPFGRHRRIGANGRFELVEIQLNKYSASFRLNVGIVPAGEFVSYWGNVASADAWTDHLNVHYGIYRWPRFAKWFSLWAQRWRDPRKPAVQGDYEELARRVAQLLPEVDRYFADGVAGKHFRKSDLTPSARDLQRKSARGG